MVSDVGQHWLHRARSVLEVTPFVARSPFSSGAETTKAHVFSPWLGRMGRGLYRKVAWEGLSPQNSLSPCGRWGIASVTGQCVVDML